MKTQSDKARAFRALHAREGAFVIPNPWDVGSARILAHSGFEALATTSAGLAWSLGKLDMQVTRDELVSHVAAVAAATSTLFGSPRVAATARSGRSRTGPLTESLSTTSTSAFSAAARSANCSAE